MLVAALNFCPFQLRQSGLSRDEIERRRALFYEQQRITTDRDRRLTPPNYDAEYFTAIAKMQADP